MQLFNKTMETTIQVVGWIVASMEVGRSAGSCGSSTVVSPRLTVVFIITSVLSFSSTNTMKGFVISFMLIME